MMLTIIMYMIHDKDNDTNYFWAILVILPEVQMTMIMIHDEDYDNVPRLGRLHHSYSWSNIYGDDDYDNDVYIE